MTDRSKLKPCSAQKVIKTLGKLGFKVTRQRASHMILKGFHNGRKRTVVVPKHSEITVGTLKGILFQAGITAEEFIKLMNKN